ncbi:putative Ig domain-containing protein [Tellurirhabdus bombi]|uniref:putative Ig domain-containing protein n=1 Tax=Tellurirhabdus bombi TaxID=2907205 RepID=UPI001F383DF9|nr:putative Ig domain-containing protein [Tellurirhabdus bombi]
MLKNLLVSLFCLLSLARPIGLAYDLPSTSAKPNHLQTDVPPDRQRYMGIVLYNFEDTPGFGLDRIENSARNGCNMVEICVHWDKVFPTRNGPANWTNLDLQVQKALQLNLKVGIRITTARDVNLLNGFWSEQETMMGSDLQRLNSVTGVHFSFAHQPSLDLAKDFVRQVTEHFQYLQQQNHLLFMSVAGSGALECEYAPSNTSRPSGVLYGTTFDYSDYMRTGFRQWLQSRFSLATLNQRWGSDYVSWEAVQPSGFGSATPWGAFAGKRGEDWYVFRHRMLKRYIDQTIQAIKNVNGAIKIINQHGSAWDQLSGRRGTLGFKNLAQNADGVKLNDGPEYNHRWSMDVVRSNIREGGYASNEVDGMIDWASAEEHVEQVQTSFTHGAKLIIYANFNSPQQIGKLNRILEIVKGQGWLSQPVPVIQPQATMGYKLSDVLRSDFTYDPIYPRWNQLYTQTNQPVRVLLDEDLLNDTNQDPRVAQTIPDQTASVGQPFNYTIPSGTFTDPDGSITQVLISAGLPANGLSANGTTISGTPTSAGTLQITVQATDNLGAFTSTQFKITITGGSSGNQSPVVSQAIPAQSGTVGQAYSYAIPQNTFSDPDGSIASIQVTGGLPAGLSYNASNRTISGTPTTAGQSTVNVQATDNQGATVSTSFPFTVNASSGSGQLTLIAPIYDCVTGRLEFRTTGGNGLPIQYQAVGVTDWSPNPIQSVDESLRQNTPLVLNARQGGQIVSYNFTTSCQGSSTNQSPIVSQAIPAQNATVGQAYSYAIPQNTFSDPDGSITSVQVTGGLPAGLSYNVSNRTISGTPTTAGQSTVNVQATDNRGATVTTQFQFAVNTSTPTNQSPIVSQAIPAQNATVGQVYSYAIPQNTFSDPDGSIASIQVTGGLPAGLSYNASNRTISGTPTTAGQSIVNVQATDNQGATVSTSFPFTVNASSGSGQLTLIAPIYDCVTGRLEFRTTGGNGLPIQYQAIGVTDWSPNPIQSVDESLRQNTPLVLNARQGGQIVSYNFTTSCQGSSTNQSPIVSQAIPAQNATVGQAYSYAIPQNTFSDPDGSIASIQVTGGLPAGLSYNASNRTISGTPTTAGQSTVNVQATDNRGATVTTQFQFTVTGSPTTNPPANQSPVVSQTIPAQSGTVGQAYSYAIPQNTFSDSDGSIASVQVTGGLPAGLSYNASNRTISGTPTTAGQSTVNVQATDNRGATVTTQFQFTVTGSPTTNPPANQSPVVSQTIPAQSGTVGQAYSYAIPQNTFSDPDGSIASIQVTGGLPAGLSYNASNRTISGTPTTAGQSTVNVQATDNRGATVATTFSFVVSSQAVTPRYEGHVDNIECTSVRGWAADRNRPNQAIGIDVYIDGTLALTTTADVLRQDLGVYLGDNGRHGFEIVPPQAYRTGGTHTIRINFAGTNQELFNHQSSQYTCPVTSTPPTNQSPIVSQTIPAQNATVGQAYSYVIPQNTFSDPDGSIASVQVTGGLPVGLSYNVSNRTISGTPTTAGQSTVNVQATDNQGATVTTQFQLTVTGSPTTNPPANQSPVVSQAIPAQTATVGQAYSYVLPANTFSDPDGSIASIQVLGGLPAGLGYNASNRTISGTPILAGQSQVTVRAIDDKGASVSTTFTFTVNNSGGTGQPITVNPIPNQTIYQGTAYSHQLPSNIFISSNPQPVQVTVSGLPAGLSYNASTRTISGTPTNVGVSTVTLTGVDGNQATASTSFQLTVSPQAATPELTLSLIGAGANGQLIQTLQPGIMLRSNNLPTFVNFACTSTVPVGSIYLEVLGEQSASQIDNQAPYTLFSEAGLRPQPGYYFVRATAFAGPNATGRSLATQSMIVGFTNAGGRLSADTAPQATAQPWVVAPNPVQDIINVSLPIETSTQNLTFEIISQSSQQTAIPHSSVRVEEGKASIDIRSLQLTRGMYYLKVNDGATMLKTVKVLKE